MVLTVKDLITTSNIHDLKVICGKEEMNREIKGIKIIEVENIEELNKVLKELRKVDSVYEVTRKK